MRPGDKVEANAFGGKKITRRLVEVVDNTAVICKEEEWQAASREMRRPDGVGFPLRDVKLLSA